MMLKPTIELEEWISYGKPVTWLGNEKEKGTEQKSQSREISQPRGDYHLQSDRNHFWCIYVSYRGNHARCEWYKNVQSFSRPIGGKLICLIRKSKNYRTLPCTTALA